MIVARKHPVIMPTALTQPVHGAVERDQRRENGIRYGQRRAGRRLADAGMAQQSVQSGKYDSFLERGIIPRFGKPEDVARTILFLLEPDNYITGQVITVDGGLSL